MSVFASTFNKEPAMAVAGFIALGALVLPYVVVPIRRSMGLPTYQWDADPKTHPVSRFISLLLFSSTNPPCNSLSPFSYSLISI